MIENRYINPPSVIIFIIGEADVMTVMNQPVELLLSSADMVSRFPDCAVHNMSTGDLPPTHCSTVEKKCSTFPPP